jgi:hypothetical protein
MLPAEVATELSMRSKDYGYIAFVLVEGDTDEALFAGLFTQKSLIGVVPLGDSLSVRTSIEYLNEKSTTEDDLPRAVGIIDADYLIPLGHCAPSENLLFTDFRDIECVMFHSDAYSSICREYLHSKKLVEKWVDAYKLRGNITRAARVVGALRFWSQHTGSNISFARLDFSKFLDADSLALDISRLVKHINGHQLVAAREREEKSGVWTEPVYICDSSIADAESLVTSGSFSAYFCHDLLVCRGHDLMEIFSLVLRKSVGAAHAKKLSAIELERGFRFAFSAVWGRTKLVQDIRAWFSRVGLHTKLIQ